MSYNTYMVPVSDDGQGPWAEVADVLDYLAELHPSISWWLEYMSDMCRIFDSGGEVLAVEEMRIRAVPRLLELEGSER